MKVEEAKKVRSDLTITFTPYEQDVLNTICMRVGGCPTGARGVVSALGDILLKHDADNLSDIVNKKLGSIYFTDSKQAW